MGNTLRGTTKTVRFGGGLGKVNKRIAVFFSEIVDELTLKGQSCSEGSAGNLFAMTMRAKSKPESLARCMLEQDLERAASDPWNWRIIVGYFA